MPEWVLQLLGIMAGAGGVYAAIRADLAALRVKAEIACARADSAHNRIDIFFDRRGNV